MGPSGWLVIVFLLETHPAYCSSGGVPNTVGTSAKMKQATTDTQSPLRVENTQIEYQLLNVGIRNTEGLPQVGTSGWYFGEEK